MNRLFKWLARGTRVHSLEERVDMSGLGLLTLVLGLALVAAGEHAFEG